MALSLHPQAIIHCLVLVPSSVGLWAVLAVIALMMAAESMPPTPPPVAESFVTVVVEFGLDLTAIWRLPAMVRVVVLAVCCDHSLFCADSLYCASSNSLLWSIVTDETCRDGGGDDGDEACQVWGRSDLMGRCTSLCDVVMGGWRWAEMAVIAEKKVVPR